MIDWARVAELRDEIGAEDFDEVVEIFLEEVDAALAEMGKDRAQLEAELHFLKGSALNLGFAEFSALCQDGEQRAHAGETDFALDDVAACYRTSRSVFINGLKARFNTSAQAS